VNKETSDRLQRWRDRHHHHDHGARTEGAAGHRLDSPRSVLPLFLSYLLSFVNVAIYWNNHHHMLHTVRRVNGLILWANTHLPVLAVADAVRHRVAGPDYHAPVPTAVYGVLLLMAGNAYYILQQTIIRRKATILRWPRRSAPTSKQAVDRALRCRGRPCVLQSLGLGCGVRRRGTDVVRSRSAHRTTAELGTGTRLILRGFKLPANP